MKGFPYNVTIFATNGKGKGSIISEISYAEEDCKYITYVYIMIKLICNALFLCQVPRSPTNLVIERVNGSHMIVSWTALTLVEARGHITHYTVYYWSASNNPQVFNVTVAHNITRVVVGNLLPGVTYLVEIAASTSVGEGNTSVAIQVQPGQKSGAFV